MTSSLGFWARSLAINAACMPYGMFVELSEASKALAFGKMPVMRCMHVA
jgi:hypothetical protein